MISWRFNPTLPLQDNPNQPQIYENRDWGYYIFLSHLLLPARLCCLGSCSRKTQNSSPCSSPSCPPLEDTPAPGQQGSGERSPAMCTQKCSPTQLNSEFEGSCSSTKIVGNNLGQPYWSCRQQSTQAVLPWHQSCSVRTGSAAGTSLLCCSTQQGFPGANSSCGQPSCAPSPPGWAPAGAAPISVDQHFHLLSIQYPL